MSGVPCDTASFGNYDDNTASMPPSVMSSWRHKGFHAFCRPEKQVIGMAFAVAAKEQTLCCPSCITEKQVTGMATL